MAKFELIDYSITSKNATIAPQTAGTFTGSIGDEIEITLNYSFDEILTGELWYNIGLFVEENQNLVDSDEMPTSGFYRTLPLGTTTAQNMSLRSTSASEKNGTATIQKTTDSLFTIVHTLFLTEDLNDWLANSGYENTDRFFQSSVSELDQFEETVDSAYQGNTKTLGFLVAIDRPQTTVSSNNGIGGRSGGQGIQIDEYTADSPVFAVFVNAYSILDKFEIFVNGSLEASSGLTAGNNFGAIDGFDGSYPLGSHPNPPVIPNPNFWYIGNDAPTFSDRRTEYIADTGDTDIPTNVRKQVVWVKNLNVGDEIKIRIAGTGGTKWNYITYVPEMITQVGGITNLHSYIPVELQFVQEDSTNRIFNLTRSAVAESDLSTLIDTDIEIKVDFSTLVLSKIRYALLNITNDNNSTDFITNYVANFTDAPVPTQATNTFTTNVVIPFNSVKIDNQYRIYCVGYDEAGNEVRAWCSDVLDTTNLNNICPTITSNIDLYDNSYSGYHLQLSTVQRVKAKLEITEAGTNVSNLTLNVDGNVLTAFKSGTNWTTNDTDWNITQIGSVITSEYNFRVLPEWSGLTKDLIYSLVFGTENETFTQRFEIEQNEQIKTTPDLTDQKIYFGGNEITDFCDLGVSDFVEMQTTKDASYNGRQTFHAWNNINIDTIEEEVWAGGVLPQLSASGVQNVDENFITDIAIAEFAPNQILKQFVGIVTFESKAVFVKTFRFFSPDLTTQTHTATQSESLTAINVIGGLESDYTFQINGSTAKTFTQIQNTGLSPSDVLTINQVSGNFKDSNINLEFSVSDSVTSPFTSNYTFPSNSVSFGSIDDECIFSFSDLVNVLAVNTTGGTADLYFAVRTGDYTAENWTLFPFDSVVDLNSAINALNEGDKYSIHIFADWTTTAKGTVQLIAEFQTAEKEYIETKDFASTPEFRDLGSAWKADGVTDYIDINQDFTGSLSGTKYYNYFWPDKTFSVSYWIKIISFDSFTDQTIYFSNADTAFPLGDGVNMQLFITNISNFLQLQFTKTTVTGGVFNVQRNRIQVSANFIEGEFNHVVMNYSANGVQKEIFLNGRKCTDIIDQQNDISPTPTPSTVNNLFNIGRYYTERDSILQAYSNTNIFDVMMCNKVLTPAEIWQIYKRGTNVPANYATHYPASVLSSRILHYPLNTGTFTGLAVNDEVGNSTANIIGQVSPDLNSIY